MQDIAHLSTLRNPTQCEESAELGVNSEGVNSDVEMGNPEIPFKFSNNQSPSPPDVQLPQWHTVKIEEVEDEDDPQKPPQYWRSYPGLVVEVLGVGKTPFEKLQEEQAALGEDKWALFASQEEWDLSQWLMKNVGQNSIDEYLKLPIVSTRYAVMNSVEIID